MHNLYKIVAESKHRYSEYYYDDAHKAQSRVRKLLAKHCYITVYVLQPEGHYLPIKSKRGVVK